MLSVGRSGSLVLLDSSRPCVSFWRAEDVLDWCIERIGGRSVLTRLELKDGARRRQLRIVDSECVQEVWSQVDPPPPDGSGAASEAKWVMDGFGTLRRDGVPLSFIPFVFHGPKGSLPELGKLPLADIIAANLDHYRLDADYKHGLHFAALPTAWVSGFDKAAPLRIGSSAAWVSEVPGASAGFLEFTGAGLAHLERAMEKVEQRMALLGARMLEGTGISATGAPATVCVSGDMCGLGAIVENLNGSLSRVLQFAQWWIQGGELDVIGGQVSFAMNTDLGACAMSGEEITAVVAAWRAGAISRESMLERLKRGEVLPDGRSIAQERALIYGIANGKAPMADNRT